MELRAAPHDGLLFLAALTDNRRLLAAWLQAERARARAGAVGTAWNG